VLLAQDKDGLDVLRLLRFADTHYLANAIAKLGPHPIARKVTQEARFSGRFSLIHFESIE